MKIVQFCTKTVQFSSKNCFTTCQFRFTKNRNTSLGRAGSNISVRSVNDSLCSPKNTSTHKECVGTSLDAALRELFSSMDKENSGMILLLYSYYDDDFVLYETCFVIVLTTKSYTKTGFVKKDELKEKLDNDEGFRTIVFSAFPNVLSSKKKRFCQTKLQKCTRFCT